MTRDQWHSSSYALVTQLETLTVISYCRFSPLRYCAISLKVLIQSEYFSLFTLPFAVLRPHCCLFGIYPSEDFCNISANAFFFLADLSTSEIRGVVTCVLPHRKCFLPGEGSNVFLIFWWIEFQEMSHRLFTTAVLPPRLFAEYDLDGCGAL